MSDRPPFILAFAGDNQGCGFHRVMMPLASLVEAGVADGRVDMAIWPDEAGMACNPDVIVWQRQVEDKQIEAMARWRQMLPNATFIYELDDYLDEIPSASFHASYMPADISIRIKRALVYCDRITTTTVPMANWLKELAPENCQIDVVPNALPVARLRERKARTTGKLRVGFSGGISHTGDLEILYPAMQEIGDTVSWVFFGMAPEDPPIEVEFHEGVPSTLYLDKMNSLDLDVMLAPLEDNAFNRCKSNLRLIEAAAIGASIIAQDIAPYHTLSPPVFGYAKTAMDWTETIHRYIKATRSERQRSSDLLRTWAGRHYTLERLMQNRMHAWLPSAAPVWHPNSIVADRHEKMVVAVADPIDTRTRLTFLAPVRMVATGLEAAAKAALGLGADLLWLRPNTTIDESGVDRMKTLLHKNPMMASAVPLATDGVNSFPSVADWTPIAPSAVRSLAELTERQFGNRNLLISAPLGPVALISVKALSMLGIPDVKGCDNNEEQALIEWGLRASTRGWKHGQALGAFAGSTTGPVRPTHGASLRVHARGLAEQLREVPEEAVLPTADRAELELTLLREQWGGPQPGSMGFAGDYDAWSILRKAQEGENDLLQWGGLPRVAAAEFGSPKAWSEDDYVIFYDDTVSFSNAGYWFNDAIFKNPAALVVYSDHDSMIGGKASPEFKPDFDLVLFLGQDYITPICAVHASLILAVPRNRTELFEIVLRAAMLDRKRFVHVPKILGSMEIKTEPETTALETLERELVVKRLYGDTAKVTASRNIMGCLTVVRDWRAVLTDEPLVSIIIPTLGGGRLIQPCVATIVQHTTYPNYEIIVVQNGDVRAEPEISEALRDDPHVRIVYYEGGFNWSEINNWAIRVHSRGEYIVTMNDDVCVAAKNWLDALMGQAVYPDVGVVGAKLVHPGGFIQHVGVVCHKGVAGHVHKGSPNGQAGQLGRALLAHEAVAVTGACMLFSRQNFEDTNGFEVALSHNYNDTLFCVLQHRRGRINIVETAAELIHPEASSRPESSTPEGYAILLKDNARLARLCPEPDPYWNPNMALVIANDGLSVIGLNADQLAWDDFVRNPNSNRILLINDKPGKDGLILDVLEAGDVPFLADLSGFTLRLLSPPPRNVPHWDIRDADRLRDDLKTLGIRHIVLRSLVGLEGAAPPVEALRMLSKGRLGVSVEIDPIDAALIAPWLVEDGRTNDAKLFGYVDMAAWQTAYEAAIN